MKLPFWGTIFTIAGVIVLCILGFWQVHRLQWKAGILAQINSQYEVVASDHRLSLDFLPEEVGFKRGYITGTFDYENTILIQPRVHDGSVGYHVFTPLLVSDEQGEVVLPPGQTVVDCTASAITNLEISQVFSDNTITLQTVRSYQPVFSASFIAHIELTYQDIEKKNNLCSVVPLPNHDFDWVELT